MAFHELLRFLFQEEEDSPFRVNEHKEEQLEFSRRGRELPKDKLQKYTFFTKADITA